METKIAKKRRTHRPSRLARLLTLLPVSCVLFYPLYLAAQLYTDQCDYVSSRVPEAFEGLKITYLSDIHYGQLFSRARLKQLVERVNALSADVILLGGDYGEDSQGALDFFSVCPRFQARLGVFGVVGNHDRTVPDDRLNQLMDAMRDAGIIPLVNDTWVLHKDGASLAIAGVDDFYNGYPDLAAVRSQVQTADFVIFAPHTPDILPECWKDGVEPFFDLVLCGHTHGGQISLFGRALYSSSIYGSRFLSGWYHDHGADILVSNGVGTSFLPIRFGAKPQIHLITLRRP